MYLSLAFKNLFRNKRRTAFTMLAIVFGVVVIVFSGSFLKGMFRAWSSMMINQSVGAFQIEHKDYLEKNKQTPLLVTLENSEVILNNLRTIPGIDAAYGELKLEGMISNGNKSVYFNGKGIEVEHFKQTLTRAPNMIRFGKMLDNNLSSIVLGQLLAEKLDIEIGDTVTLAVKTLKGGFNMMVGPVVGIKNGSHFDSSSYVEIHLEQAQKLMRMPGRVSQILVRVDDYYHISMIIEQTTLELNKLNFPYVIHDYTQLVDNYSTVGSAFRLINLMVSLVLFIVVGAGIANAMFMAVRERKKEIGTLMAIGTEANQIRWLFLIEGILIGVLGAVLGSVIGLTISQMVIHHGGLPFPIGNISPEISWSTVGFACVMALIISTLAAWLPANVSARLNPIEALHES